MTYRPDRYFAKIRIDNKPRRPWDEALDGCPSFETWEEAHQWLIADRAEKVARAQKELAAAERALAKAKKLKETA